MSILDGILGGGDNQSSSLDLGFGTDPQLGVGVSDVLDFMTSDGGSGDGEGGGDTTHLTGIGDAGIGFSAPTFLGVSASQQSSDSGSSGDSDNGGSNDGGLLNGLL